MDKPEYQIDQRTLTRTRLAGDPNCFTTPYDQRNVSQGLHCLIRVIEPDAIKSKYANTFTPAEQTVWASLDPSVMAAMNSPPPGARYVAPDLPLLDVMTTAMAAYAKLRDELVVFDARTIGLQFDVPMLTEGKTSKTTWAKMKC